jgi:NAD(P)-dependent dehydrogenase (short-subunit alcohol dehydrogenase family)
MATSFRLDGKVAIITGASRGIGEAIARAYAAEGARVVLAARKMPELEAVAGDLRASGSEALAVACHTGSREQIDALFATALTHFGQVDVVVNNAAANPYFGPMLGIEDAAWDKTFEVNVKGYFAMTRALVSHLRSRGAPGSIVNIASVVGLVGMPLQGVYAMTKAAVISMTKTLALELGDAGIRVNAIAPGLVDTKFASALTTDPELLQMFVGQSAIKRPGRPEEIAGMAVYLASEAASFMTGQTVVIDGGWTV